MTETERRHARVTSHPALRRPSGRRYSGGRVRWHMDHARWRAAARGLPGDVTRLRTIGRVLADLFARLFVGLQFFVVVAWIAGAAWIVGSLPSISSTGAGSPGELLP